MSKVYNLILGELSAKLTEGAGLPKNRFHIHQKTGSKKEWLNENRNKYRLAQI